MIRFLLFSGMPISCNYSCTERTGKEERHAFLSDSGIHYILIQLLATVGDADGAIN